MVKSKRLIIKEREPNLAMLINLFDGDVFRLLKKSREYNKIEFTMSTKTIERLLIFLLIRIGWSDEAIMEALTDGDHAVTLGRIERLRKELCE